MVKGKSIILTFVLLLAMINIISAADPHVTISSTGGLEISYPTSGFVKSTENLAVRWWVYNMTTGKLLTNATVNCTYNIMNSTGYNVWRVASPNISFGVANPSACQNCFNLILNKGNFTNVGYYSYQIRCDYPSTNQGGFLNGDFVATGTGVELTTAKALIYSCLFFLFIFLFVITLMGASKLPDGNDSNGEGELISINNLKYFRSVLLFIAWLIFIAMFYLSSNLAFAYLGELLFAKVLFMVFRVCLLLTLPLIVIWFIWIFVQIAQDKKMKRLISKGIYPRGKYF